MIDKIKIIIYKLRRWLRVKKKAFYILLGMVLMFGFNTKVKADGSCRCYYGTDAFGIVVNVTDSGVPDVTKSGTQSTYINL